MRTLPVNRAAVLALLTILFGSVEARSAKDAPAVGVVEFTGAKKKAVRARVVAALEKAGVKVASGAPLQPSGDTPGEYKKLAAKRKLGALVTGHVELEGKRWKVTLAVRDGDDGEVVREEVPLESGWLPGLYRAIDKKAAAGLEPGIEAAAGDAPKVELAEESADEGAEEAAPEEGADAEEKPSEEAPAAAEPTKDPEKDEPARGARGGGKERPRVFGVALAVKAFSRGFAYDQDVNRNLRRYNLDGAPAASLGAEWYPGAHVSSGAAAHVGLIGSFEHSFGMASERPAAGRASYSTAMQALSVGLRGRLPLGEHELGLSAAYGNHSFEVDGDEDPTARVATGMPVARDLLPDVAYSYLRPGLDARFRVSGVTLGALGGYRHVVSLGGLGARPWFPAATAAGWDVSGFVGYDIAEHLAVLGGVEFRRYTASLNPRPTDLASGLDVAKRARDQYLAGWVGAEWRLPGE